MDRIINICKDFTNTPGGRYKKEGKYSGEEFREKLLIPKFIDAKKNDEKLIIDFDGAYGYPVSFLEEAFGGLSRKCGGKDILKYLVFISKDEPSLIDDVKKYIQEASDNK